MIKVKTLAHMPVPLSIRALFGLHHPQGEWDNEPPWLLNKKDRCYGEINAAGPEVARAVTRALVQLIQQQ